MGNAFHARQPLARQPLRLTGWIAALLVITALACNMQPTPAPPPTPTPLPGFCRDFLTISALPSPPTYTDYQWQIADFLTRGGSPDALGDMLRQWGVVDEQHGGVNAAYDFNGDNYLDIVVTLRYPSATAILQPPGQLIVLTCNDTGTGTRYWPRYVLATAPESTTSMPQIIFIGDMTADRRPEIAFYTEQCTALACFEEPIILTWNPGENNFRSLSERMAELYVYQSEDGTPIRGLPVERFRVEDLTGDGPMEFIIEERHIPQREAGPHLPATYTFTWHGVDYAEPIVEYGQSQYRIHAVREADRALRGGDLDEAIRLYQQALDNRTLIPWGGVYPKEENYAFETAMLDAYTRYRLVMAHAAARDGQAQQELTQMQQDLPWQQENLASHYTRLAEIFMTAFLAPATGGDPLRAACDQVRYAAQTAMPVTYQFLGDADYFGPSLSTYTVNDLCPF